MRTADYGGSENLGYIADARQRVLNFAMEIRCGNRFGLLHEVVSKSEYNRLTNHAPKRIVLDPGHLVPMEPHLALQHKQDRIDYERQEAASAYLRAEFLSAFPDHLFVPMKVGGSLHSRTVKYMIKELDAQLLTLTERDFDFIKAQICRPYVPNSPVRTVLATEVLQNLALLATHGQQMSTMEAIRAIKGKFHPDVFRPCWAQYAITHGPVAVQSPESLIAEIIKFVEERMSIGDPLPDVALKAAALPAQNSDTTLIKSMQVEIQQLREITERAFAVKAERPTALRELHYCHTHGPMDESGSWHESKDCLRPGPNHDRTASVKNHKGGRATHWRAGKPKA